jgi:hypothetical protein
MLTSFHRDRLTQTGSVFDAHDAVDRDTDATREPPAAVVDVGTANSLTLTKGDLPVLTAPAGTKHFEVRVQARRTTGTVIYEAWQARSIRLFMPDGIKVAEGSVWTGLGGGPHLTVAGAGVWISFGAEVRLTVPAAGIFTEWGGQPRLTAARAELYIEVLP